MSTGLECLIVERDESQWYYVLQDWNCPVGAWDWREYATTYGPFPTKERAIQHLSDNHANPGGWMEISFREDPDEWSDTMERLFTEAHDDNERRTSGMGRYGAGGIYGGYGMRRR